MSGSQGRIAVALPETIGRFRVSRRLARGCSSDAFLCYEDGAAEPDVVVRLSHTPYRGSTEQLMQLSRDAFEHARLAHPNIVKLLGVFSVEGRVAMATEYVDGTSVNVLRTALTKRTLAFDAGAALHVAARVFAAMAAAHALPAPLVLGCLRPSLVLVTWDGDVRLFTIDLPRPSVDPRSSGVEWAPHSYMAPEQLRGEPASERADVYAGALMICALLGGEGPGPQPEPRALASLDPVDPALARTLRLSLDPSPERRLASAGLLAGLLQDAADSLHGRGRLAEMLSTLRGTRSRKMSPKAGTYRYAAAPWDGAEPSRRRS